MLEYTLINVQTSKVTEIDSKNNSFCFTWSNTAGKVKVPKLYEAKYCSKKLTYRRRVLYNFCWNEKQYSPLMLVYLHLKN